VKNIEDVLFCEIHISSALHIKNKKFLQLVSNVGAVNYLHVFSLLFFAYIKKVIIFVIFMCWLDLFEGILLSGNFSSTLEL
jgi:hypothetical protein